MSNFVKSCQNFTSVSKKSLKFRFESRNSTISYSVLRWDLTRSVAQLGMRETAIALSYWALPTLLRRCCTETPKIHPRLTSSLSFHFDSECKTRRHTFVSSDWVKRGFAPSSAGGKRWPGLERHSTAVARQTEKTSDGSKCAPAFCRAFCRSILSLRASSRLPFHFQRNYCKCGANGGTGQNLSLTAHCAVIHPTIFLKLFFKNFLGFSLLIRISILWNNFKKYN